MDFVFDTTEMQDLYGEVVAFSTENALYSIVMVDFTGEGIFRQDFEKIVQSVTVSESATEGQTNGGSAS